MVVNMMSDFSHLSCIHRKYSFRVHRVVTCMFRNRLRSIRGSFVVIFSNLVITLSLEIKFLQCARTMIMYACDMNMI